MTCFRFDSCLRRTSFRPGAGTSGGTRGDKACAVGVREDHFDSSENPLLISYDESQVHLAELPDVMRTWEHFDYSWANRRRLLEVWGAESAQLPTGGVLRRLSVHLAHPLLICKPRLRTLFAHYRVRGLRFETVALV
jgi:hypothetical protein